MSHRVVCDQRSLPCDGNILLLFSHVKIAIWYPGLSTRRFCLSQKGWQTLPAIRKLHSPLSFLYYKNSVTIACVIFMMLKWQQYRYPGHLKSNNYNTCPLLLFFNFHVELVGMCCVVEPWATCSDLYSER